MTFLLIYTKDSSNYGTDCNFHSLATLLVILDHFYWSIRHKTFKDFHLENQQNMQSDQGHLDDCMS